MTMSPIQGFFPAAPKSAATLLELVLNVKRDFGASGSSLTTTGTITAGSNLLTLDSSIDFVDGQGIAIANAGAAISLTEPTSVTATVVGTSGTATYEYTVVALDGNGGSTAASETVSITTGNASLSAGSYNQITWSAVSGALAYAVYRVQSRGTPSSTGFLGIVSETEFNDIGIAASTPPFGVAAQSPDSPLADVLVATILSGGGTNTITLSESANTSVVGVTVEHDDSAAISACIQQAMTNSPNVYLPQGVYKCHQSLALDTNPVASTGLLLRGASKSTVLDFSSVISGTAFQVYCSSASADYLVIEDLAIQGNTVDTVFMLGQSDFSDAFNETSLNRITVQNFGAGSAATLNYLNTCRVHGNFDSNGSAGLIVRQAEFSIFEVSCSAAQGYCLYLTDGFVFSNTFISTDIETGGESGTSGIVIDGANVTGNTFLGTAISQVETALNATAGNSNTLINTTFGGDITDVFSSVVGLRFAYGSDQPAPTVINGSTSGFIQWWPIAEGTVKRYLFYLNAYQNDTTTSQTVTFPQSFSYTPLVNNQSGAPGVSVTTKELVVNPDTTSTYTGYIEVTGF